MAQVAPQVYELNLATTIPAAATAETASVPVYGAKNITLPLREDVVKTASASSDDFVLEIRNGNGVRRMAWRTSQYLAGHGYTTKRLTNQRGFNVKVTRIFYLPGYLEEAQKLLAHLPKDTVLTEYQQHARRHPCARGARQGLGAASGQPGRSTGQHQAGRPADRLLRL